MPYNASFMGEMSALSLAKASMTLGKILTVLHTHTTVLMQRADPLTQLHAPYHLLTDPKSQKILDVAALKQLNLEVLV